jgi:hypothetical protein
LSRPYKTLNTLFTLQRDLLDADLMMSKLKLI